jgi:hypothetical protein
MTTMFLGLLVTTWSFAAGAVTITFDNQTGNIDLTTTTYSEAGYDFNGTATEGASALVWNTSGPDDYLDLGAADTYGVATLELTRAGAAKRFSIESFMLLKFYASEAPGEDFLVIESDKGGYLEFTEYTSNLMVEFSGPLWQGIELLTYTLSYAHHSPWADHTLARIDDITVIPEPGTAALLAMGLAVLGHRRRRQRA